MPDAVTLVRWRDAKTDPPEEGEPAKTTNAGILAYEEPLGGWCWTGSQGNRYLARPQPTVWCDPVPPPGDALTLDDLRAAAAFLNLYGLDQAERGTENGDRRKAVVDAVVPRLRRAIDEATQ